MKVVTALLVVSVVVLAWEINAQKAIVSDHQRRLDTLTTKLQAPRTTIDLQEKCAKQAREQFRQSGWEKEPGSAYQNHYSDKLAQCFMLVVNTSMKSPFSTSKVLTNAFEGRVIANYMWFPQKDKKYWEVRPFQCDVILISGETQQCGSSDEFEELVKAYLE